MYNSKSFDVVIGDAQPLITTKQVNKNIARPTLGRILHNEYYVINRKGEQQILSNKQLISILS